jgi:hypothetical protein
VAEGEDGTRGIFSVQFMKHFCNIFERGRQGWTFLIEKNIWASMQKAGSPCTKVAVSFHYILRSQTEEKVIKKTQMGKTACRTLLMLSKLSFNFVSFCASVSALPSYEYLLLHPPQ